MRRILLKRTINHVGADPSPATSPLWNHLERRFGCSSSCFKKSLSRHPLRAMWLPSPHRPAMPFLRRHTLCLRSSSRGFRLFILSQPSFAPYPFRPRPHRSHQRSRNPARMCFCRMAGVFKVPLKVLPAAASPFVRMVDDSHRHSLANAQTRVDGLRQPYRFKAPLMDQPVAPRPRTGHRPTPTPHEPQP